MTDKASRPLPLGRVLAGGDWINASGHLSAAGYIVIGEKAIAPFLETLGFTQAAIAASGMAPILKEMHVTYQREALEGHYISVDLQVLAAGEKSAHVFLTLRGDGDLKVATLELAIVKLDLKSKRVVPWTSAEQARLVALAEAHAGLPRPGEAGRGISFEPIRRPS